MFFARGAIFRDAGEAENRRLMTRGRRRTKRSFESGDDHAAPIARQGDSAYPAFPRIPCRNQAFGHWCYINITLHPIIELYLGILVAVAGDLVKYPNQRRCLRVKEECRIVSKCGSILFLTLAPGKRSRESLAVKDPS